ncbi:MAG: aminoglycoside phosphotransferase family protein [Candidatus Rokubacteria bacterium]|nr:aminoglycoside phosphotransferase family protein [Candidatus Rokubacteria bacterium]
MSVWSAEFAWPGGDRPGHPDFHYEPSETVVEAIKEALTPSFPPVMDSEARFRALRMPNGPVGRYRLITSDGSWFVRVSVRWGNPGLERSITRYLASRGVHVNALHVAGRPLQWNGRVFRVDVRPMIAGRHFDGSADDLRSLASTLAACHRALVNFPGADAVRAAASVRSRRLVKIRDFIVAALKRDEFGVFAEQATWASDHRDWLVDMTEQFEPRLDEHPHAQCLHGEIHPGNVVFRSDDGAAVLVDFEESVHVFAPPAWDLAFLVQRFCLCDDPSLSGGLERLSVIARAYGGPLPGLARMMRQAAWFSMATIVDLRISQGVATPVDEYEKFVRLERQAREFEGVL